MTLRDAILMASSALIAVVVSTVAVQSSSKNVVRVHELILENDKGEDVAVLSTFSDGQPYFYLSNGTSSASIHLDGQSSRIIARSGRYSSGIGLDKEMPFVKIVSKNDQILVAAFESPLVIEQPKGFPCSRTVTAATHISGCDAKAISTSSLAASPSVKRCEITSQSLTRNSCLAAYWKP